MNRFLRLLTAPLMLLASTGFAQGSKVTIPFFVPDSSVYGATVYMPKGNAVFHDAYYLGPTADTLSVSYFGYFYPPPEALPPAVCMNRNAADFRDPMPGDFSIAVFPENRVSTAETHFEGNDSVLVYLSFPIVVANNSADTLVVGRGRELALVLEAKDDKGNWQPVERPLFTSGGALVVPGGEIAISTGYFYKGAFETYMRFRLGNAYSETFRGWMNPAAFPD